VNEDFTGAQAKDLVRRHTAVAAANPQVCTPQHHHVNNALLTTCRAEKPTNAGDPLKNATNNGCPLTLGFLHVRHALEEFGVLGLDFRRPILIVFQQVVNSWRWWQLEPRNNSMKT
jgi:hypothetical protein